MNYKPKLLPPKIIQKPLQKSPYDASKGGFKTLKKYFGPKK